MATGDGGSVAAAAAAHQQRSGSRQRNVGVNRALEAMAVWRQRVGSSARLCAAWWQCGQRGSSRARAAAARPRLHVTAVIMNIME
jgi:hypothetical protein